MSAEIPTREVARRVLATEFNDATHTFKESEDERAPLYLLLPSGERANRIFVVGTLTETEDVGEDSEYWQGRVVDPTGTFYVYAGQYQPEAAGVLRDAEPPAYVAVVGKPRTYETDDGSVNVSVRPESISVVDADTRDRWVFETAERTLERIAAADEAPDEYVEMAADRYEARPERYRQAAIGALESLDEADDDPAAATGAGADGGADSGEPAADGESGAGGDGTTDDDPATVEPGQD